MIDREKVIKGLEVIKQFFGNGLPDTAEMFDSYYGILNDAQKLLKEQEEKEWISVNDRLPDEKGSYLVAYKAFQYTLIGVKRFAKNLYSVDKYYFPKEHRPGWYEYDDEYGYFERTDVTHWMPLPNLPDGGR